MIHSSLNFLRRVLIGIAEVIPGVSGGTLALITGIYSRLLNNIDLLFKSLRNISHPKLMARNLKALEWKFILPVFIGRKISEDCKVNKSIEETYSLLFKLFDESITCDCQKS